ncbi:MAG: LysR substrate-binding domain-containing protein, partial [Acidobacteriota bacterium]
RSFPGARVDLRITDSAAVCSKLMDGECELGFVGARIEISGLRFHHFAYDEMALVVPNDDEWRHVESISLDDLALKPFLARERGSGTRLAFERIIGRDLKGFNLTARLGSTGAVKEALKAGLGVSVLSLEAVRMELEAGLLKTVQVGPHQTFRREFFLLTNPGLTLSPLAESFLKHALAESATAHP